MVNIPIATWSGRVKRINWVRPPTRYSFPLWAIDVRNETFPRMTFLTSCKYTPSLSRIMAKIPIGNDTKETMSANTEKFLLMIQCVHMEMAEAIRPPPEATATIRIVPPPVVDLRR